MSLETSEKQVISKRRVTDHGEVFTNQREVKAMLELVKHETERIESKFLEPLTHLSSRPFPVAGIRLQQLRDDIQELVKNGILKGLSHEN